MECGRRGFIAMIAALALVGAETEADARRGRSRRSSYRRRSSYGSSRSYGAYSGGSGGGGYYANCSQARAAGAAPIMAGDAGYSRRLDRDGDGVACE
jgi:hypothetical protein